MGGGEIFRKIKGMGLPPFYRKEYEDSVDHTHVFIIIKETHFDCLGEMNDTDSSNSLLQMQIDQKN